MKTNPSLPGLFRSAAAQISGRIAPLVTALILSTGLALASPGDLDAAFNPEIGGPVSASATQADGKVLLCGTFQAENGIERLHVARFHADGRLDSTFSPDVNYGVTSMAVQPDGKIIIHGPFSRVGGKKRNGLARLNADGSLDGTFNPPAFSNSISCMAVQADGKIILGGFFTIAEGSVRDYFARLNADGTLDSDFDPEVNDFVEFAAVQADGKVLLSGEFHAVAGIPRHYFARLNVDGTLDSDFNLHLDQRSTSMAVQADGKIILGGSFPLPGGSGSDYIARFHADGTPDSSFSPRLDYPVLSMAAQADGKLVIGGYFTTVGDAARSRIARLNSDGTLDGSFFNTGANYAVTGMTLQADGRVLLCGDFSTIGGIERFGFARLLNDPATQALSVSGSHRVTWLRGGASPEVEPVTFELSTDGGNTYSPLGGGTRIAGGWERTALSLPASGEIRARGRTAAGHVNGTSGLHETLVAFGSAAPEMAVEQVTGTDLPDGGTVNLGTSGIGDNGSSRTFTIGNTGTASLTGLTVTIDGPDHDMFVVTAGPSQPVPAGGHTTFTARFDPIATGAKNATLHIASNDSDESPFDIALTGTGEISSNADLAALSMDAGAFSRAFASGTTRYFATVASGTEFITLTPTASGRAATITVNGSEVISGIASGEIELGVGTTIVSTVVTAGDGLSTKTYTLVVTRPAPGTATGDAENGFDPDIRGNFSATAVQADGKIVIGGAIHIGASDERVDLVRLHPDGSLDSSFHPQPDGSVTCVLIQPDGKIVVGGTFNKVAGTERLHLARLNPDGTLDTAFHPAADAWVWSLALQADGKILVAGNFSSIDGMARNSVARLNADGTLDPGFAPDSAPNALCVAVQADGKVWVGGSTSPTLNQRVARFHPDGALDESFDPELPFDVRCMAVQPEGKVLIGTEYLGLYRLNTDGSPDRHFNPEVQDSVFALAVQSNGKILIGGRFLAVGNSLRRNLARLHPDGTVDSAFAPVSNGEVYGLTIQEDGMVILCGIFNNVGGSEHTGIARLLNDPATDSLTVQSRKRVQWLRGGTSPEFEVVTFEVSVDGGKSYRMVGAGTPIAGGWEKAGIRLPRQGEIRARGFATGGSGNGSKGMVEKLAAYGGAKPEISVKQTPGRSMADGGRRSFGRVTVGDFTSLTFTIKNTGSASLTGLQITKDGPDQEMFTVVTHPAAPLPGGGGRTTFAVKFAPTSAGDKTAVLHIASNDANEDPFDITVMGTGTLPLGSTSNGRDGSGLVATRATFGSDVSGISLAQSVSTDLDDGVGNSSGNVGVGSDHEDPDHDGIVTLAEYGLNLPPGIPNGTPFAVERFAYPDGERLRVFVQRNPAHHDVTVEVQAADHLDGPWSVLATSTLGAPFSGPGYVSGDSNTPGVKTVEVRDATNVADTPVRFLRVRVTR
jgi:uncharacterized delta-60 repeat protein